MTTPTPSSAIVPGALRTLGGVWRLTYPGFFAGRRLLVLLGLAAVLYLLTTQNAHAGSAGYFYSWAVEFYLIFLLPAVTFLTAAGALRDDMQPVSVDYLLTRPLRRASLVLYRYASQFICLQAIALLPLATLCVAGSRQGVADLWAMLPYLLLAQVLVVGGFSALGFLFGALTTRYFVLGVVYGLVVEIGVGQIPTQISRLSMTNHILAMFSPLVPGVRGTYAPEGPATVAGAFLLVMVIALGGALAVFSLREFTGSGAAEK